MFSAFHRVTQLQLPGEGSLRPLRDQYVLTLLYSARRFCRDRQDVPLGGDVHTVRIPPGRSRQTWNPSSVATHPSASHRGTSPDSRVCEPIHLPERVTKRVESQHTHCKPPEQADEGLQRHWILYHLTAITARSYRTICPNCPPDAPWMDDADPIAGVFVRGQQDVVTAEAERKDGQEE